MQEWSLYSSYLCPIFPLLSILKFYWSNKSRYRSAFVMMKVSSVLYPLIFGVHTVKYFGGELKASVSTLNVSTYRSTIDI